MPFEYKSRAWLQPLDYVVEDNTYASVLSALAAGISAAQTSIEHIEHSKSPELAEIVWEEQGEVIESFLGTAYVLCQTRIAAVTRRALSARKQALHKGLEFPAFEREHEVRARFGDRFDKDKQYSKVEVLWQLANYFKHRDQWPRSTWAKPTGLAKFTVPVLKAARLEPSPTGNLRAGAEALGITDFARLTVLEDIIARWANEVRSVTRKAFGR